MPYKCAKYRTITCSPHIRSLLPGFTPLSPWNPMYNQLSLSHRVCFYSLASWIFGHMKNVLVCICWVVLGKRTHVGPRVVWNKVCGFVSLSQSRCQYLCIAIVPPPPPPPLMLSAGVRQGLLVHRLIEEETRIHSWKQAKNFLLVPKLFCVWLNGVSGFPPKEVDFP